MIINFKIICYKKEQSNINQLKKKNLDYFYFFFYFRLKEYMIIN